MAANHGLYCRRTDKPIAGLLTDLRRRGLLDDTLVMWGGEFGRMPMSEQGRGRDHNPWGYSVWLAGRESAAALPTGPPIPSACAVENTVHVHDLHATLLHLVGLDHEVADLPAQRPLRALDRRRRSRGHGDPRMRRVLPVACVALSLLTAWRGTGGTFAMADDAPQIDERPITAAEREHWSFLPLADPLIPDAGDGAWSRHPVDRFLRQAPRRPVDRATAARGTPHAAPSRLFRSDRPAARSGVGGQFINDSSPDAYERLVERLLASPAYGERFAQHWLDLARFAETDGFEHDLPRANAWRYRDWVIRRPERDMPFDGFLRLQIAGDELHPGDARRGDGYRVSAVRPRHARPEPPGRARATWC